MVMTPPHMQFSVQLLFKAGIFPINTSGVPGVHGVTVAGTQGIGVNTPKAAAVAAATAGLAMDEHIPKGGIFTIGSLSIMVAAGISLVFTRLVGNTIREEGATPNGQVIMAPIHTCTGMVKWFYWTCDTLFEYLL